MKWWNIVFFWDPENKKNQSLCIWSNRDNNLTQKTQNGTGNNMICFKGFIVLNLLRASSSLFNYFFEISPSFGWNEQEAIRPLHPKTPVTTSAVVENVIENTVNVSPIVIHYWNSFCQRSRTFPIACLSFAQCFWKTLWSLTSLRALLFT